MTNGDRLRSLSDIDIALHHFCGFFDDCPDCPLFKIPHCDSIELRMEWLQKEEDPKNDNKKEI